MWSQLLEYLRDASLVAKIQEAFGVKIHYTQNLGKSRTEEESNKNIVGYIPRKFMPNSDSYVSCRQEIKTNGYTEVERKFIDRCLSNEKPPPEQSYSNYIITNYFWYYLFLFGTELGDEIFYSTFIPFWFWNIDGAVGRRIVLVWSIVMTVGQMLKDVIRWPRPACPPAVRLQSKWSQEYGMPSTHAMIAVSIPFGALLFTTNRYIYPLSIGWTIAFLWCTLVCMSRLYLGMHTVLDVLAGLILAIVLMIPLVPLVDIMDRFIVTNFWVLLTLFAVSIATIIYYPRSERWTPTRGDTAMVVSVTVGVHAGTWLNYSTRAMLTTALTPPYDIIWPSYLTLGRMILRTVLGFCSVAATKITCKFLCYTIICAMIGVNSKDLMKSENCLENKNKIFVDLVYKYITCFMIGVNTVYLLPIIFATIGVERPTFYTEI